MNNDNHNNNNVNNHHDNVITLYRGLQPIPFAFKKDDIVIAELVLLLDEITAPDLA